MKMYTFVVNGKTVTTDKKQSLLRFLRDELHLTSVKDGCSQGACGACTVIIDGVTCKACVPTTDRLEGKKILTVEGLSDWESKVFTYAYGEAGAVQCGFCIPGMVMCTKALLDVNPEPLEGVNKIAKTIENKGFSRKGKADGKNFVRWKPLHILERCKEKRQGKAAVRHGLGIVFKL